MPYTTLVAGTTVTASWANASVRDQVVTPFATAAARTSAVTVPVEGMVSYQSDVDLLEHYDGSAWRAVGGPYKAVRITNTGSPMYTTSGTTELDLARYSLTSLTALTAARMYLYRALVTWTKTVPGDDFSLKLRANTAVSGTQVGQTGNVPTLTEANGSMVYEFLFKGDGGAALTITSLYLSAVRGSGTGTFSSYGAGAGSTAYRAWAALYDVGGANWSDVA
jgi:hypothetical protein